MRNVGLFAARAVLGRYLVVHGAQKLFGAFDGPGLATTGTGFEAIGLRPGKVMAAVAGASELGGGILTATGITDPLGPIAIADTMAVAATVHPSKGHGPKKEDLSCLSPTWPGGRTDGLGDGLPAAGSAPIKIAH